MAASLHYCWETVAVKLRTPRPPPMSSVRHWHVGRLAAVWLAAPVVLLCVRWLLRAGSYEAHFDGHRVTIVSGFWPSGFASTLTTAFGVLCILLLVVLTGVWMAGRRDRRRLASITESSDRRPLM